MNMRKCILLAIVLFTRLFAFAGRKAFVLKSLGAFIARATNVVVAASLSRLTQNDLLSSIISNVLIF